MKEKILKELGYECKQPRQAAEWEAQAEREFSFFAESVECDIERTSTFYQFSYRYGC